MTRHTGDPTSTVAGIATAAIALLQYFIWAFEHPEIRILLGLFVALILAIIYRFVFRHRHGIKDLGLYDDLIYEPLIKGQHRFQNSLDFFLLLVVFAVAAEWMLVLILLFCIPLPLVVDWQHAAWKRLRSKDPMFYIFSVIWFVAIIFTCFEAYSFKYIASFRDQMNPTTFTFSQENQTLTVYGTKGGVIWKWNKWPYWVTDKAEQKSLKSHNLIFDDLDNDGINEVLYSPTRDINKPLESMKIPRLYCFKTTVGFGFENWMQWLAYPQADIDFVEPVVELSAYPGDNDSVVSADFPVPPRGIDYSNAEIHVLPRDNNGGKLIMTWSGESYPYRVHIQFRNPEDGKLVGNFLHIGGLTSYLPFNLDSNLETKEIILGGTNNRLTYFDSGSAVLFGINPVEGSGIKLISPFDDDRIKKTGMDDSKFYFYTFIPRDSKIDSTISHGDFVTTINYRKNVYPQFEIKARMHVKEKTFERYFYLVHEKGKRWPQVVDSLFQLPYEYIELFGSSPKKAPTRARKYFQDKIAGRARTITPLERKRTEKAKNRPPLKASKVAKENPKRQINFHSACCKCCTNI